MARDSEVHGFSFEAVRAKRPDLDKFFANLLRIANSEEMLPEHMQSFLDEMTAQLTGIRDMLSQLLSVFMELYAPYLEGLSEAECEEVRDSLTTSLFTASATAANATVKKAAEEYRQNQLRTQLTQLWSERTEGSKDPRKWSEDYRTPILCCICSQDYDDAPNAFGTLNNGTSDEASIHKALDFLQRADFWDDIASAQYRDQYFAREVIGVYSRLLPDVNAVRSKLEHSGISTYDWYKHPKIEEKIRAMAQAEYDAGGSYAVVDVIEGMDSAELKQWLRDLARHDMELDVRIMLNREE